MTGRKNAMLTTEDRRWLTGKKEYEGEHAKQQRYQRRRDIRERIYNSILDFTILFHHLEEEERKKLFGNISADGTQWDLDDSALDDGIRDALAFLLYSVGATKLMTTNETDDSKITVAERLLTDALYQIGRREDILVENFELEIDATSLPISDLLDDLEAGNSLSPARLRVLLETNMVNTREIQDRLREMVFDDE
ncbi:hypothetical protein [Halococcus sp. IIIV-5B]|uniref:hypothetical protein n=1 Tax=Halococcus sp. IIIV-5B TaxID=2321230 RepID=UPI000E759C55|nr:hypothetical protein [Halococcus sp. IIIV-5B]RJT04741.1 hypothetical protein D3261_09035 [Halococcus sp. IIIV-5B]